MTHVPPYFLQSPATVPSEPRGHFQQPLRDVEACERDLAVLECEVANDSAPVTWYLEDRQLKASVKYSMEEWGKRRRLTIRDVGADDDGVYLCETANGSRSIAELAVRGDSMFIYSFRMGFQ